MGKTSDLAVLQTLQDGDGRLYALLGRVYITTDFWCREVRQVEMVGVLDIGAGRAYSLTGGDLGESRNQAMIDGVSRILSAGGWPGRAKSDEPVTQKELPTPQIIDSGDDTGRVDL